ncbi:MAG: hypothetical protein AAFX04_14095 [Pseudomonadota bacterium]
MTIPMGADRLPLGMVTLAWLAVSALLLIVNFSAIATIKFPDPDDLLRLLQVRDWLAGQGWYDVTQYRMNPPQGGPMHWSRLVDLPLALVIFLFTPLVGSGNAELVALVLVPLLTLFVVMWLGARLTARISGREAAMLACFMMVMIVPVTHQLRPMRIDHHGWQIALALVALGALIDGNHKRGGLVLGLALAGWLSISMEGLPLAAAFMGYCAILWLIDPEERHRLANAMVVLAGASAALFAATRLGSSDALVQYCDALAPVHIVIFGFGALALTGLAWWNPQHRLLLITGFAVTGGTALAILATQAPQCATGAFAELDPLVREFWYERVYEGLPLWRQTGVAISQTLALPLLAMVAAWLHYRQHGDSFITWLHSVQGRLTVMTLAALAVAILVERASAVASLYAMPLAAGLVMNWLRKVRTTQNPLRRVAATLGLFLMVTPGLVIAPASALVSERAARIERVTKIIAEAAKCELPGNIAALNALPRSNFMTPLDIGPALLYATDHNIVASGHHRNDAAMRDIVRFFSSAPDEAHSIAQERNIDYVAFCEGLAEPRLYAMRHPEGLMATLSDDEVPAWLEPVPFAGAKGLRVWRVQPQR